MKKILSLAISFLLLVSLFSTSMEVYAAVADAKIDTELKSVISESETGTSLALVTMEDVDHDEVMVEFRQRYPYEYKVYMFAKFDDPGDMTADEIAAIDDADLQRAIELKRQVYREYYSEANEAVIDSYYSEEEILYTSVYTPVAIVETNATDVARLSRNEKVRAVSSAGELLQLSNSSNAYPFDDIVEQLEWINTKSGAAYVRDTRGYDGAGVKIGMVEVTVPDVTNEYLAGADITVRASDASNVDDHSTAVAMIMVGKDAQGNAYGIAPEADLYCAAYEGGYKDRFFAAVEWLLGQGVNVINLSALVDYRKNSSDPPEEEGVQEYEQYQGGWYDDVSQWVDHIAVQHDVHFTMAAGNSAEIELGEYALRHFIASPAMAYNAITVGSSEHYVTEDNSEYGELLEVIPEFQTATYSCYKDGGTSKVEKPNLVAYGCIYYGIEGNGAVEGTSFAAPQVAGVIAQLCTYNSALKYKQTVMSAILMASAAEKVEPVLGTDGTRGCLFDPSVRVENNPQISDKAGAGIMNARMALGIATAGNYWSPTVYNSGFPYTKTVYIDATVNTVNRVVIFWLKRNTVTDHTSGLVDYRTYPIADLNLEVFDPNGVSLETSTLTSGNFEIVQFFPELTGNYTIKITGSSAEKEYIGIALW